MPEAVLNDRFMNTMLCRLALTDFLLLMTSDQDPFLLPSPEDFFLPLHHNQSHAKHQPYPSILPSWLRLKIWTLHFRHSLENISYSLVSEITAHDNTTNKPVQLHQRHWFLTCGSCPNPLAAPLWRAGIWSLISFGQLLLFRGSHVYLIVGLRSSLVSEHLTVFVLFLWGCGNFFIL